MTDYQFVTLWRVDAPLEKVWNAIASYEEWPQWWPAVESMEQMEQGNAIGVGAVRQSVWKLPAGWALGVANCVVKIEDLRSIVTVTSGDLEGEESWEFLETETGTLVRLTWKLRLARMGLASLVWLWKPLLKWCHTEVMEQGRAGLAERLETEVAGQHSLWTQDQEPHLASYANVWQMK